METRKAGLGFEMKQMLKLLGAQMYKGDEASVAMKELLQNSFDAVKTVANPKIDITVHRQTLMIEDNGVGMSPNTVENVYLKIGGTLKDHLDVGDRSGGLGLAKVQFFMTAESINVETVKDGVKTNLTCTQEELLTGEANLSTSSTTEPNGTVVSLTFPSEVEDIQGRKKSIRINQYYSNYPILKKPLLLDGLEVRFNKELINLCIPERYSMKLKFSADWGDMVIHANPAFKGANGWGSMMVLSAGLYQFERSLYNVPLDSIVDIKPRVKAGDVGYPFNNTREDFNVSVKNDIEVMDKYLKDIYSILRSDEVRNRFETLVDLDYIDPERLLTAEEREEMMKIKSINRLREDGFSVPVFVMHEIMETYGDLVINRDSGYKQTEIAKKATLQAALPIKFTDTNSNIKFHNNTSGDYNIEGAKAFLEDYASLIKKALMEPEIKNAFQKFADEQFVVGVSFDKEYSGCFLTGSVNALFLNPMSADVQDVQTFIGHFMHTLIHEIAHHDESGHDSDFCRKMADVSLIMYKTGMYNLYEKYAGVVIHRHIDTYKALSIIYNQSNPLGKSLNN